jgi:hypothetical protein
MTKSRKRVLWGVEMRGGGNLVEVSTTRRFARLFAAAHWDRSQYRIVRLEVIQRPQRKGGGA